MADPGRNGDRTEFKVVGRTDVGCIATPYRCKGITKYCTDIIFPNQLFGKILRSPYAHATIKSMDTSKAEALPGVKAVVRWDDPEIQAMGPYTFTKTYLTSQAVREDDDIGVVVCAETEELCDEALKLIDIEWEVLPHVIDPVEADKPGAPLARPDLNPDSNLWREYIEEKGDIVAGFAEASHIVEYDITFNQMNNYWP